MLVVVKPGQKGDMEGGNTQGLFLCCLKEGNGGGEWRRRLEDGGGEWWRGRVEVNGEGE